MDLIIHLDELSRIDISLECQILRRQKHPMHLLLTMKQIL